MKDNILLISYIAFIFGFVFLIETHILDDEFKEYPIDITPDKISPDTVYKKIDSLQIISDTIEIYYETKVQNYRILPAPKRVELFAKRISR
jgi:hypothetical protein